ncbi:MAG: hypothetical protein IV086_14400 [Hyphomonadaceae bacterium]|nr:hypothetical protein [Hyphomonadaceae bacterium]
MMPFPYLRALRTARRRPSGPRGFWRATTGNVALIVALSIPGAATLAFGAIDVSSIMGDRARMRSIAEAAALAGARNLSVAMSESNALEQARAMAEGVISEWRDSPSLTVAAEITELHGGVKGVTVRLDAARPSLFGDLLPPGGWHYSSAATASSVGMKPLCVLAFDDAMTKNFLVQNAAEIRAPECLVHSNGDVEVTGGRIEAGQTQAVGAATGDITPDAITDAPPVDDPFADIDMAVSGLPCVGKGKSPTVVAITIGVYTIKPGVHCGAISVGGNAVVTLAPGEHRFTLGSLVMRGAARLLGDDVVLIFDKTWATKFKEDSVINLTGRRSGALAGFVMMADRGNTQRFEIDSTHVERLDGVIYVPDAELLIGGRSDIARQSDWTVIVANQLTLSGNPRLYLNADYGASDITAPAGVGPRRDAVRLVE